MSEIYVVHTKLDEMVCKILVSQIVGILHTDKVIYPKYSKNWPYLLAYVMGCDCSKMLNHGLNHGLFLSLFKFFGWKYIPNLLEDSGLKSRIV